MKWRHSKEYQDQIPQINAMHQQELHNLMQKSAVVMHGAGDESGVSKQPPSSVAFAMPAVSTSGTSTGQAEKCSTLSSATGTTTSVIMRKIGDTVTCIKPLLPTNNGLLPVK